MSKAFTRESDDIPDRPAPRAVSTLPPGKKNYLTPYGARRLQEELTQLIEVERPRIPAQAENVESQQKLQKVDERIYRLQQSIQSAVVVEPPAKPWEEVHFGATVTVRDLRGEEETYRIVGVDETDYDRGWVSWLSPLAKALLNARRGARVPFKFPSGETQLEIVSIVYE